MRKAAGLLRGVLKSEGSLGTVQRVRCEAVVGGLHLRGLNSSSAPYSAPQVMYIYALRTFFYILLSLFGSRYRKNTRAIAGMQLLCSQTT